ncbi:hypothetical protein E4U41_005949 [Claviceps citrina]|nr:hypothetical protein E4U41_005949 [Claviceps citrina]
MLLQHLLPPLCLLMGLGAAAPFKQHLNSNFRRGRQLNHDQIRVIPESLPNNAIGRNMKRFQPYFNNEGSGCWPYPAVDSEGNWSGGLAIGGSESGDCTDSQGQVYVRGSQYRDHHAFLYAWYAPKDQSGIDGGHRHEWESVAIWLDGADTDSARIVGGAVSAHGEYKTTQGVGVMSFKDGHPLCKYYSDGFIFGTHHMGWTHKVGGLQPAVAWEQLTRAAQDALQNTDWGDADFPLGYLFRDHLARAYPF